MAAKVILLGNDADLLGRWRDELSARGWIVFSARDVQAAIDLALREQPHAFIADARDFNGHPVLRTLRSVVEHDVRVVGIVERDVTGQTAGFDLLVGAAVDFEALHQALAVDEDDSERLPTTAMPAIKPPS